MVLVYRDRRVIRAVLGSFDVIVSSAFCPPSPLCLASPCLLIIADIEGKRFVYQSVPKLVDRF